ncbi:MAG: EAL domain-containing protein [Pseudomonadota bacterium]
MKRPELGEYSGTRAAVNGRHVRAVSEQLARDYNYLFRLAEDDTRLLQKHHALLVTATAGFAEKFYDYLFDNPDIADVLYAYERAGGDVGMYARSELQHLVNAICPTGLRERVAQLLEAGRQHQERCIRPAWLIGAYELFIDYLHHRLPALIPLHAERMALESLLVRILLHDLGLTLEGYWSNASDELRRELAHESGCHARTEELLAGIPYYLWSVDVGTNTIRYASFPLRMLYAQDMDCPFPCLSDTHAEDGARLLSAWQDAVNGMACQIEARMTLADAAEHWYRVALYPDNDSLGRPAVVHCVLEEFDRQIAERRHLQQLATTDALTGLPNRALWNDHLNLALAASRRVPGSQFVVISLDINQFKMYNDTLGRDVGDILLKDISERLSSIVRESDSLSRLGGDQFGIMLQPVHHINEATERVIAKILDCFDLPFTYRDKQLWVSLTLGIACFPGDGDSEETLLHNAESAMQRAKRNGLPYQYFDPANDVSAVQQLRYSGQIKSAIDNNEFTLHYQPLVELQTASVVGAEALLRWEHPLEGMVMPQRIIPVAEQLGMITSITDWVLVTALRQCRSWQQEGLAIPVSINVSARSFQNPRLLDKITWALREAGVEGDCLEIEITEATLMQDIERATEVLERLNDAGVTIAIDDFGTGYSSLSYLKALPIDTLKIDQSFIQDIAFDRQDIAIVRTIIDLGHNLGFKVVAEGVENVRAWNLLTSLGCDVAQGFHISQPVAGTRFSALLAHGGRLPL